MKGLSFKSLSAQYIVNNTYIVGTEENYHSNFCCRYHINILYNDISCYYNFKIYRSDIRIDEKPVRKLMDRIIMEIGESIYPLSIIVSPNLEILDILNFKEIKERWHDCTKNLLEKYPSRQLERYVNMSKKNVSDIPSCINSLYKDTFFNVYFRDIYTPTEEDEALPILWNNFPRREMNQTYLCQVNPMKEHNICITGDIMQIVPSYEGYCTMDYELGKKGEIQDISGKIRCKYKTETYIKQISVKEENLKIDNHFAENVIL